jgi:hypothetical protein
VQRVHLPRPFTGPSGAFERLPGLRDVLAAAAGRSYLEPSRRLARRSTLSGKVPDLFPSRRSRPRHPVATNAAPRLDVAA